MANSVEELDAQVVGLSARLNIACESISALTQMFSVHSGLHTESNERAGGKALEGLVVQCAVAALLASHPSPDQLHAEFQRLWQSMRGALGAPEADGEMSEGASVVFRLFQQQLSKPIL